jgi:hypothetical protein
MQACVWLYAAWLVVSLGISCSIYKKITISFSLVFGACCHLRSGDMFSACRKCHCTVKGTKVLL